jgi:UDP-glucose 4-epimerase
MSSIASIVVTGASGFLGRAVTAHLTSLGLPFIAVSRRSGPGLHQVADYTDTPAADILIHLAEESDRSKVNLLGEAYLEHAAMVVEKLSERAATFIYASSGVVYGDVGVTPFGTDACVEATDVYSRSKIRNEAMALSVGGIVLRLSNLFGVGMSPCNVVSDIAKQLGGTAPLVVRDDSPVRDFLSINEAANAIVLLAQTPQPGIFNIGSGFGVSIRELALLALRAVKQQNQEIEVTNPSGCRSVNILDISDTKRCLGWGATYDPLVSLETYFRNGITRDI